MLASLIEIFQNNQVLAGVSGSMLFGSVLVALRKTPLMLWEQISRLIIVNVEVTSSDKAYGWVSTWLAQTEYANGTCRRLSLATTRNSSDAPAAYGEDDESKSDPKRFYLFPAVGWHWFWYERRLIWMHRSRNEKTQGQNFETITLNTFGTNRSILRKIIANAATVAEGAAKNCVEVYPNDGGDWYYKPLLVPRRSFESVILPQGLIEDFHSDAERFFGNREWYSHRGLPWRRGYLLHGDPGCGKTSLVLALASVMRLPLYVLNLSIVRDDGGLFELFRGVPERAVVLIEDIDAAFVERKQAETSSHKGISFSMLLNVLDGAVATEGRIVVMTTNHREKLDPALIRPGRVDMMLEIPRASRNEAVRFYKLFFPDAHAEMALEFSEAWQGKAGAEIQMELQARSS